MGRTEGITGRRLFEAAVPSSLLGPEQALEMGIGRGARIADREGNYRENMRTRILYRVRRMRRGLPGSMYYLEGGSLGRTDPVY